MSWFKKRYCCTLSGDIISEVWFWQKHHGHNPCLKHEVLESTMSKEQLIGMLQNRLTAKVIAQQEIDRNNIEIDCLEHAIENNKIDSSYIVGTFIVVSDSDMITLNRISRLDQAEEMASKKCMDNNVPVHIYRLEQVCVKEPKAVPKDQPIKASDKG